MTGRIAPFCDRGVDLASECFDHSCADSRRLRVGSGGPLPSSDLPTAAQACVISPLLPVSDEKRFDAAHRQSSRGRPTLGAMTVEKINE
jgi:hypothetical protein